MPEKRVYKTSINVYDNNHSDFNKRISATISYLNKKGLSTDIGYSYCINSNYFSSYFACIRGYEVVKNFKGE